MLDNNSCVAEAIASCVSSEQLNANLIVPSIFDQKVVEKVAVKKVVSR
jgi:malate dehydrogenase (oxaloacetate-decarboxylating)